MYYIKTLFNYLDILLAKISIFLIKIYQYTISPDKGIFSSILKGTVCAHHPHCSEYSVRTFKRYGFISGIGKVMNRITSCTPSNSIKYDPEYYKVVFFSSAPIGVPFLETLHQDKRFDVVGVVTNPDQKSGRGMQLKENIIKTVGKKIDQENDKNGNKSKKYNIIILHGHTGRPNTNFIPQLKIILQNKGHTVHTPRLPNPDNISFENKIAYIKENYNFNEKTILIGHSMGSLIAMKVIESLNTPIAGFISVAGMSDWRVNQERYDRNPSGTFDEYDKYKEKYGNIVWNRERLQKLIKKSFVIGDKNDPAVPPQHQLELGKLLQCKTKQIIPESPHCTGDNEPNLIKEIDNFIENINTPNLLILHGYNSSEHQNFFQNLKQKTEKLGIKTTILNLPNNTNPSIPEQTQYVLDNYTFDENTIILGHSLGSVIGLNVLQQLNTKIKQYISVAGFIERNSLTIEREYFQTFDFKFDKKKILGNLSEKSIVIYDPKDKNIPVKQAELLEEYFSTTKITLPTQKPHFMGEQEENLCEYISKKIGEKNKQEKIILLHGKNDHSNMKRYPRVKKELEKFGYEIQIPDLPNSSNPEIKERLAEIDELNPDENTILIGYSRGGMAILRWLEKKKKNIKKAIIIGIDDGKPKKEHHKTGGFYTQNGYDYEEIKKKCKDFVFFHSKDDNTINYENGLENIKKLNAKLYSFEDKNHFGGNEKYGYKATTFPQLVNEVCYNDPYFTFIQTPKSLRLDSKKYAEEAHNFKLRLEAKNPDYLVVIAYGKIIPQYILDIPNLAPINIHGSLLPKYRGASPIQSVFLNNETESGITIMKMDATMDTGNMIDKLKTKLKFNRNTLDLIERMKEKGPKFLNKTLWKYGKDLLGEETQNEKQAIYCEKIEKSEGEINPYTDSLEDIYAKYRAYFLRPKIYFKHEKGKQGEWEHDTPVIPTKAGINPHIIDPRIREDNKEKRNVKNKIICTIDTLVLDEEKIVETKTQPLLDKNNTLNPAITEINIKPEGKKTMDRKSFVNGYLR